MPMLDYFAAREDLINVFDFLFRQTDVRVFESYSEPDREIREFHTVEELDGTYPLGQDVYGHQSTYLQLWSPSVMESQEIKRFALDPKFCQGHTFRFCIEGWGLIQMYLGGIHKTYIISSHFGHNSRERARAWESESGVDWEALKKLSNKIRYHIGSRLAVAKLSGRPILSQAYESIKQGYIPTNDAKSSCHYDPAYILETKK